MRRFGERLKLRTDLRFSVFYLIDDKSKGHPLGGLWHFIKPTVGECLPTSISMNYFLSLQQAFFSGASTAFLFLQQASPLLQVLSLSSLQAGSLEQPSCPLPMNLPFVSYIPIQAAFSVESQPIESHIAAHCSLVMVAHLLISHLPIISFSQCCISTQAAP